MVFAAILGPALPLSLYFIFADSLIFDEHRWLPTSTLLAPDGVAQLACTAAALLLMVYARLFIDVNDHSGHGFWRDRLSKAFSVGHSTYSGELFHHDNLPFNELGPREGSAEGSAPYHLLNMTLNLQSDRRLANRSPWGDFFLFRQHFLG